MSGSHKPSPKGGSEPRSATAGVLRRPRREDESTPDSPASGTIQIRTSVEAQVTHALDIALVQLQTAEDLLVRHDAPCAGGQIRAVHAIIVTLERHALSKAGR